MTGMLGDSTDREKEAQDSTAPNMQTGLVCYLFIILAAN